MLHHIGEGGHTRVFLNLAAAVRISTFPGKWRRKCISVLPGEERMTTQLEMCYYSPPDFPKETRYLIIVFIQVLTLADRKQTVAWQEPCLRMLLEPMTKFLHWVSHKFPFDADHRHNWAPLSSVLKYLFSISSSRREEMIWNIDTEPWECRSFSVWGFFVCLWKAMEFLLLFEAANSMGNTWEWEPWIDCRKSCLHQRRC